MADAVDKIEDTNPPRRTNWSRRYPPLVFLAVTLLITILILPTALNLPQSNPTTVLEYAPIPPEDDDDPPPAQGTAISSLGLGTSEGLSSGVAPDSTIPGPGGKGKKPITKRCVGKPLRQTEDPNSPPCVPFFDGDNGGSTWQGVTADEITVILYHQGGWISDQNECEQGDCSTGEQAPTNSYCDLDRSGSTQAGCQDSLSGSELSVVLAARALSRYFNERFQTYGRHVHIWLFWAGASSAAARRAEANKNWEDLQPFAVLEKAIFGGFMDHYLDEIARKNTMVFGSFSTLTNKFYNQLAPMVYSFWPDIEHWADGYVDYVCTKLVGKNAVNAGDPSMTTQPRRFALMYTTDEEFAGLHLFRRLVDQGVTNCGGNIVARVSHPHTSTAQDTRDNGSHAVTNVAIMRDAEVTTILHVGGMETKHSHAAAAAQWFPEWVVAGDRLNDTIKNARHMNQAAWAFAWTVSVQLREDRFAETPSRQAYREAEPNGRQIVEYYATTLYREYFQMFKAIQVAGPILGPDTADQGLHAIPRRASPDAYIAACFYDPNDYSCVKDAHEAWWDPSAPDPNGQPEPGCYRMVDGGKRYLPRSWPSVNKVFQNPNDPCNGIYGTVHNYT